MLIAVAPSPLRGAEAVNATTEDAPSAVALVLAGTAAVGGYTTGSVTRLDGPDVYPTYPNDRYTTAAAISKATFAPGVPVAYIASGLNFPDALAGAAAGGFTGGPVLLVNSTIPAVVSTELRRLQPKRIVVLGGAASVSVGLRAKLIGQGTIAAGANHACALLANTTVKCWGENAYGQLGDGTGTQRLTPVPVIAAAGSSVALSAVTAIAAGDLHSCALLANGTVKCWGRNYLGALGDGTNTQRLAPVTVLAGGGSRAALTGVVQISAGSDVTCALLASSAVKCWGFGYYGELGDGTTFTSWSPVSVVAGAATTRLLTGVTAIAAGGTHVCALMTDATMKCWGSDDSSPAGPGSGLDITTPVTVKLAGVTLTGVDSITAGGFHTCATLVTRALKCWGNDTFDQVGDFEAVANVSAASAGGDDTCIRRELDGMVECWGWNNEGELGQGSELPQQSPTPMPVIASLGSPNQLVGTTALAVGDSVCAVVVDGTIRCWGGNSYGEDGDGTQVDRTAPVTVIGFP